MTVFTIAHTGLIPPSVQPVSYCFPLHMCYKVRTEQTAVQLINSDSGCLILLSATSNTN